MVLSVVHVIILVTGVVGNLATCVVIVWNSHMHTATNYYLISLAISDTITLVLGNYVLARWKFCDTFLQIALHYFTNYSCYTLYI